jgi:hypothetical protein
MNTRLGDNLQSAQSHLISLEGVSLVDVEKLEPAALREALRAVLSHGPSSEANPQHNDDIRPHSNTG